MGKLNFSRNAGETLFDYGLNSAQEIERGVTEHIKEYGFEIDELKIEFDEAARQLTLSGCAADNETREKLILCAGNIAGIACVDDQMQVIEDESTKIDWYTVQAGDNMQDLSKRFLRDYMKYMEIVYANEPMLVRPDRIYPGQMLRIPPETRKCFEPTILRRKPAPVKRSEQPS